MINQQLTLESSAAAFLRSLAGRNLSAQTHRAYATDLRQFLAWLGETNGVAQRPDQVTRLDVTEYLAYLAHRQLTGVTRARKLAALREYFRFLEGVGALDRSPVRGVDTPKREQRGRSFLTTEEYTRVLAAAGSNARDFCILTLFLQTGIRISELCALTLGDIDLKAGTLLVREGKGQVEREIALERKATAALKAWQKVRPASGGASLFTNYRDEPLSEWGVRKLLAKHLKAAGVAKKITPHSLRHTFASHKARQGVSAFMLKDLLGHKNIATTQIYVHLGKQDAKKVMEATSL